MWSIVTGGSSGLGLALAKRLAKEGSDVLLVSRSAEKLEAAREQILATEGCAQREVRIFPCDLSEIDAPEKLFEWTTAEGIIPHTLVNDAGMYIYKQATEIPTQKQRQLINLNINALVTLCRLYGEQMAQAYAAEKAAATTKPARRNILNIASYSVYMPIWGFSLYASSKAFVRTFSRCIGKELGPRGVKVTAVAPAGIDTGLMKLRPGIQKLASGLGILASPDKVARCSIRAMHTKRISYWIPVWPNVLGIPFLWMLQPVFKKVL